jgi:hypothetical protein
MASFWDQAQKKVIRANTRNVGPTIWDQDATNSQVIDSLGHDHHDQGMADSITDTLHLRGWNQMLADLNAGGFKVIGMAVGVAVTDAVNMSQLNSTNAAVQALQTWQAGPTLISDLKSGGKIRHKSVGYTGATVLADASTNTRFTLVCNSNINLTIQKPNADDPQLGTDYCVEGSILITNGATPGNITLVGVAANNVLGVQDVTPNAVYILTYCIHRLAGNSYREVYSWAT